MERKIKQLVSNTMFFAIGNASSKVILFLLMPLYTSALRTAEYGISDTLNTLIELVMPILTLCVFDAVFRFVIDENSHQQELFSIGISMLLKGIAIAILAGCVSYFIFNFSYAILLVLMYAAYATKQLFGNFIRGINRVRTFAANGIVGSLTLVLFSVVFLLWFHMGIQGYLLAIIASNTVASVYMFLREKLYRYIQLRHHNKKQQKELLKYSLPIIPTMVSWWINNAANRYILLFFEGASVTGLFSAASKLPAMINLLSSIFQQAWQYSSANEYDKQGKNSFYSVVFRYYSSFIITACSLVLLVTPIVSKVVLQGEFYVAWRYVPLLLLSATLGCYSIYFGGFYTASKKNIMLMISTVIGSIINLTVSLFFTPVWGVYGALLANVLCYLSIVIIRIVDTRKYVVLQTNWAINIATLVLVSAQSIYETFASNYLYVVPGILFCIVLLINSLNLFNVKAKSTEIVLQER